MPVRKHKVQRKVDSDEVQGEGSFVVLHAATLGEVIRAQKAEGGAVDSMEFGVALLKRLVVDWNWVDDEDKPLPKPKDDPDVIDGLPLQELTFLVGALGLTELAEKQKN